MLISCNKKRHELSSEGKYTTPTFKALKTRYIALKNDTIKSTVYSAMLFLKTLFKLVIVIISYAVLHCLIVLIALLTRSFVRLDALICPRL